MYDSFAVASLYLLDRDKYDAKAMKSDRKGLEIKNPYKGCVCVCVCVRACVRARITVQPNVQISRMRIRLRVEGIFNSIRMKMRLYRVVHDLRKAYTCEWQYCINITTWCKTFYYYSVSYIIILLT